MFEEWKSEAAQYVLAHVDRKSFKALGDELPSAVRELADLQLQCLFEQGVIDAYGESTGVDYDEDDLLEEMLRRYEEAHPCDEERALLLAALADRYLLLSEEYNEDR